MYMELLFALATQQKGARRRGVGGGRQVARRIYI